MLIYFNCIYLYYLGTIEAATPMNTPLNAAPISGRDGLPQPTVATIGEEEDEAEGGNPASVLARVS